MSSALRVLLLLIGLLIYHEILVTYHEISIYTHALFQGLWNPALLQATTQTTSWDWRIPTKMPFDKTFSPGFYFSVLTASCPQAPGLVSDGDSFGAHMDPAVADAVHDFSLKIAYRP